MNNPRSAGSALGASKGRAPVPVRYRALSGCVYDARVVGEIGDRVALEVIIPACTEPVRLTRIPFLPADTGARGSAFLEPK